MAIRFPLKYRGNLINIMPLFSGSFGLNTYEINLKVVYGMRVICHLRAFNRHKVS
jgi:hypothetical protein